MPVTRLAGPKEYFNIANKFNFFVVFFLLLFLSISFLFMERTKTHTHTHNIMNGCAEYGWILCVGKKNIYITIWMCGIWMDIMCREEHIHNNMFPSFPSPKRPRAARQGCRTFVIVLKVAMLEIVMTPAQLSK
jgi:hypothetical protein